jgi:hypothetical protein
MQTTAVTYIREPKTPMNTNEVLEGLSTEERQLVIRLIQMLKRSRKGSTRTASRQTHNLRLLGDLAENFLLLFLEGDPLLSEKLQDWFEKYFDRPKPMLSNERTPVWDEFMSKIQAVRLRRAKRLENFLKNEQVME